MPDQDGRGHPAGRRDLEAEARVDRATIYEMYTVEDSALASSHSAAINAQGIPTRKAQVPAPWESSTPYGPCCATLRIAGELPVARKTAPLPHGRGHTVRCVARGCGYAQYHAGHERPLSRRRIESPPCRL